MNLLGVHDAEGVSWLANDPGWVVVTEAIGCDPNDQSGVDYRPLSSSGLGVIVRLNNGYGPAGTIPLPDSYPDFARRVANFVAASSGCSRWLIGNEPNHANERPNGAPIYPDQYADCYRQCRQAIRAVPGHEQDEVLVAAIAPWNDQTGDWLLYFGEVLAEVLDTGCDGICLHTYTHGTDPALITSTAMMAPPYEDRYYHFLAYEDFLHCVPPALRHLPVYITETDQDVPWSDVNDGWIQRALMEIDAWNRTAGTQKILSLCCYRAQGDQWAMAGKPQRLADFAAALALGISSPGETPPASGQAPPTDPTTAPPEGTEGPPTACPAPEGGEPPDELPDRDIDPALTARGVTFAYANVAEGVGYWRVTKGEWLDTEEALAVGPDHHILGTVQRDGAQVTGLPMWVTWPDGETTVLSKADEPNATYNYDYPMSPSLHEFTICVQDGNPSDVVSGIGMGKDGNPNAHTSTWIDWEWAIASEETPPDPGPTPPSDVKLIWPVDGPITQYFGTHGLEYPGEPGHDGIDFGVAMGTPVYAPGDGIVKMVDNDEAGLGLYIRIYLPAYGFHGVVAHLSEQHVQIGQQVKQGQIVGLSGNSGNSSGPHCHYSCRLGTEEDYYELHDGYDQGAANPLAVYALVNGTDPNTFASARGAFGASAALSTSEDWA